MRIFVSVALAVWMGCASAWSGETKKTEKPKPLFRDFMGLCVHTVQFKPDLYAPICRHVRDYHGFNWDMGKDTDFVPQFPFARNRVSWDALYGAWTKKGYVVDASIMFAGTPPDKWKDLPRDAHAYGKAFAAFFGPSGRNTVDAAEIGNEPGHYDDKTYRTLFENMAKGFREGDPALKIATCAAIAGASHKYAKSLECVKGLEDLYDVINMHTYAQVEGWPTWKRSYPEDPDIDYLKDVLKIIQWRNENAPGKEIWITEFGWDATTKPNEKEGTFKKWQGVTDLQQAQYLVRSFLVFAGLDVDRAYIYFFNDNDKPSVHAAAGLTRGFKPKSSFYAVAHLYKTLGDYRFARVVRKERGDLLVYEFSHKDNPGDVVWAVWSPTGENRTTQKALATGKAKVVKVEAMPLAAGDAQRISPRVEEAGTILLDVSESPLYVWLQKE